MGLKPEMLQNSLCRADVAQDVGKEASARMDNIRKHVHPLDLHGSSAEALALAMVEPLRPDTFGLVLLQHVIGFRDNHTMHRILTLFCGRPCFATLQPSHPADVEC